MSTKRTAPGTWISDKEHKASFACRIRDKDGHLIAHVLGKEADAAFIVLADHHFDAMEKALWNVRGLLPAAYATTDDDEIAESLGRAQYHIDELLKAIDAERNPK